MTTLHREGRRWSRLVWVALAAAVVGVAGAEDPRPILGEAWSSRRAELATLIEQRDEERAVAMARQLLAGLEGQGLEETHEAAEVLDMLTRSLRRSGASRSPETLSLAERGLELSRTLDGATSHGAVRAMVTLADILTDQRQFDRARTILDEALAILERPGVADDLTVADAYRALGNLHRTVGDFESAVASYTRALDAHTRVRESSSPETAELLIAIASATRRCGDLAGARRFAERAVATAEDSLGSDHPVVASALNTLAIVLREGNDVAGARRCLERALGIWEVSYGPNDLRVAGLLNNLGNLTRESGDLTVSRDFLERSLAIRERTLGPGHPDIAQSLGNLALVAQRSGDLRGARDSLERALAIRERTLGPDHPDVATILTNLGELRADMGEPETARDTHQRALAIRIATFGDDHPLVAESLHNLAIVWVNLGEIGRGRDCAERALAIFRRTLGDDHPRTAIATLTSARFEVLAGHIEAAVDDALRAEDIARDALWFNTRQLAERDALLLAGAHLSGRHLALTLLASGGTSPSQARRVWEATARSRALVLSAASERRRLSAASSDPAVASARAALDDSRDQLAATLVRAWSSPGRKAESAVAEARSQVAASERALATVFPAYARDASLADLSLVDIAASLPEAAALVSIVRYENDPVILRREALVAGRLRSFDPGGATTQSYLAFVLRTADSAPLVVPLGTASELEAAIDAWSFEASRGALVAGRSRNQTLAAYRAAGQRLRRLAWDPVARHLDGVTLVLMVPDGAFHRVSWASLPDDAGGYLVDSGPMVHRLSAERDVIELPHGHRHGRGLLALGGATYDAAPSTATTAAAHDGGRLRGLGALCASLTGTPFGPLPATSREIDAVTAVWRQAMTANRDSGAVDDIVSLVGKGATEAAFRRASCGRRVLHLATHGFALTGSCPQRPDEGLRGIGGLAPAGEAPVPGPAAAVAQSARTDSDRDQPPTLDLGLLAGLALAGANRHQLAVGDDDDGILTAEEISGLDLDGVEWVVLSACDTGSGDVQPGEGVIGLQRAFRIAGAHTVIMSLWAVEDESAQTFMDALYRARLIDSLSTPAAMHAAAHEVLTRRRERNQSNHPFYWAGFVATGDWS